MLQGKRLLIFDFDGTVADTSPLHASAFAHVLAPLGVSVDYSTIAGLSTMDAIRRSLNGISPTLDERALEELVRAKQEYARKLIGQGLRPLPGVDRFLRWARPRYRLAMVSSGSRGTVSLALDKLGYAGWFDPLICADDVKQAKPSPEGFLLALRLSDIAARDALVFEDSVAGFHAAMQAGLMYVDVRAEDWASIEVASE